MKSPNAYEQCFVRLRLRPCPAMSFFLLHSAYTIKVISFLYSSLRLGSENNMFPYMMLMITVQQHSEERSEASIVFPLASSLFKFR